LRWVVCRVFLGVIDTLPPLLIEIVEEGAVGTLRRFWEFNPEAFTPSRAQVQGP